MILPPEVYCILNNIPPYNPPVLQMTNSQLGHEDAQALRHVADKIDAPKLASPPSGEGIDYWTLTPEDTWQKGDQYTSFPEPLSYSWSVIANPDTCSPLRYWLVNVRHAQARRPISAIERQKREKDSTIKALNDVIADKDVALKGSKEILEEVRGRYAKLEAENVRLQKEWDACHKANEELVRAQGWRELVSPADDGVLLPEDAQLKYPRNGQGEISAFGLPGALWSGNLTPGGRCEWRNYTCDGLRWPARVRVVREPVTNPWRGVVAVSSDYTPVYYRDGIWGSPKIDVGNVFAEGVRAAGGSCK